MIIVTGATGKLGAGIVEGLLGRVPAEQIAVCVRDPEAARSLEGRGVRVRRGDFGDPRSLETAFAGATQVLVVSPDRLGEAGVALSTAAIDAAYRAGAERVLYTSHQAASPDSLFAPALDHAAVESHLARTGHPYTALRNGYYTTSLAFHLGDAVRTGELVAPADGPVSWTARSDLAAGAAAILAGDEVIDGPTPPLTAAAAVDLDEVLGTLSELIGRPVRRRLVDDEAFVASLVERGTPEPFARLSLGTFRAARRGEFAVTDPTLGSLIGRAPESVGDGLRSMFAD